MRNDSSMEIGEVYTTHRRPQKFWSAFSQIFANWMGECRAARAVAGVVAAFETEQRHAAYSTMSEASPAASMRCTRSISTCGSSDRICFSVMRLNAFVSASAAVALRDTVVTLR